MLLLEYLQLEYQLLAPGVVFIAGSAPGGLREPSDLGGATLGDIPFVLIHSLSGGVFLSGIRPSSTMLTKQVTA